MNRPDSWRLARRASRAGSVAVLLAVVLGPHAPVAAQSPTPGPGVGIRLVDAPTNRRDDPRARIAIVDHIAPGARFSRRIEVSNGTPDPVTLELYPVAADVSAGRFRVQEGRSVNEASEWVSVTPSRVTLRPWAVAQASVSVAVPDDVTAGEQYAAVVAELPARAAAPGHVAIASRVGVRLYLSVGGGAEPASDFVVESLRARRTAAGRPRVTALVRNTGARALDLTGELVLADGPGGLRTPEYPVEKGTSLAVGASAEVGVDLDPAIPPGPWNAVITLRSGRLVRTATGRVMFPSADGSASEPVRAGAVAPSKAPDDLGPAVAASVLLLLAVIACLLLVVWQRHARRRRRNAGDEPRARVSVEPPRVLAR